MHRPPSLVKTATAVLLSAVLVGACVTKAHGATVLHHGHNQVAPMGTSVPIPEFPPSTVGSGFDGLESRVKQATSNAADAGADMSIVILDRHTGQMVSNGNGTSFPIASVAKLYIADDLLLQVAKGQIQLSPADRNAFDVMLRSSDDGAAEDFWNRSGGDDIISRVSSRYGLTGTSAPYNGRWFNTLSTADDLVRYYDKLLTGSGGLPAEQADVIINDLSQSTPTGIDGYPQRFGIPDGLSDETVAVKQGWMCCWDGGNWMHMSTGVIGADHRYVMVIGSLQPTDDSTARNTLTQAVKTMFPGGRI
ncbi:MAG TPA: hypothetical protein VFB19_01965 [Mycobacterium sp.]|nr:hypothetical protein [Mycobacterium sp.]